jgi:tripartite-type tricarboxylate transporter receptor subunit TctC
MPTRREIAALLAGGLAAGRAQAQDFPTQPVRLIVPFAAGGPADAIARLLGRVMGQRLGQPIVVESRSGAGGVVGVEAVARSRPDGHTLVLASTGAIAILPHLMPRMPYDPLRDLAPVGQVLSVPQVMVVGRALPVTTLAEFLAEARRRPRQITYGSAGNGSTLQMAAELLRLRAGIELTHVPYRGAAPAVTDLLAGQIDMMMGDIPVLLPQIRSNAVRALGVTARERSAALPEVPTIAEAGVDGVFSDTWYGLLAPAGTPPSRIALLQRAMVAALEDGETRRALLDQGGALVGSTPEAFAELLRTETAKWGEVVRAADIRLE